MSLATCPSGQGAVCKTVYTGSSPVVASIILSTNRALFRHTARFAPVTRGTIRTRDPEGAEQYADVLVNIGGTDEAGTSGSMSQRR
jgi:hypothetical protein